MKLKKLLTLSLAGALLIGGVVTTNAAELDLAWYAAKNPDVVAELGDSPEALRLHYEMFGKKEGRAANDHDVEAQLRRLFKAEEYAALYPDVKAAFGEDEEALFQHYIGYGLLEARRPAEKVSQAAAVTLKTTVEKALADAGVAAAPGSAQLVEIITGTIPADEGGAAVQAALVQAAPEVEKAVAAVVEETTNPAPAPSSGGSSSSSSSSSSSAGTTTPAATAKEAEFAPVIGRDSSSGDELPDFPAINGSVSTAVNADGATVVTFGSVEIPKHYNADKQAGYWVGIGVPYLNSESSDHEYAYYAGWDAIPETLSDACVPDDEFDSKASFYWNAGGANKGKKGYLVVTDGKSEPVRVAEYILDFGNVKPETKEAIWAPLEDHGDDAEDNNVALNALNSGSNLTVGYDETDWDYTKVTFKNVTIPKHKNTGDGAQEAYWFGIGVPYTAGYTYSWGFAATAEAAKSASFSDKAATNQMTSNGKDYAAFYWGWSSDSSKESNSWGYLVVKKDSAEIAKYIVDFSSVSCKSDDGVVTSIDEDDGDENIIDAIVEKDDTEDETAEE